MSGLQPYNLSISSSSPAFRYAPFRDGYYGDSGEVKGGWRSSFKGAGGANSQWPTPSLNNWLDGVAYEETEFDGASVSLSFEGTALYFCIISAGEGDTYTMSINNTNTDFLRYAQPMASACGSDADAIMIAVAELPYGTHSVQLVAHPEPSADEFEDPDFYFYGGVVTLGMNGTYIQDVTIDDSDRSWTYFGNWTSETTNPYASDNTLHRSCYYGPENFVRYTFSNASVVRLLGQTSVDTGPYTVTLVGQTSNISASYNASNFWTTPQAVLFFAANLNPLEQYTISLINYDSQHPNTGTPLISNAGNNTCASIDALVLTQSHPSPPAPPPSSNISSSSTGAIIGGVVGALGILIMAFALWRYNKMRDARRTAQRRLAELDPALEDALEASRAEPTPFFLSAPPYFGPPDSGPSSERLLLRSRSSSSARANEPPTYSAAPTSSASQLSTSTQPNRQPSTAAPTHTTSPKTDVDSMPTEELVRVLNQRLQAAPGRARDPEEIQPPEYTDHV